ncbi:ABC transporter substrate-binding protein [Candidatus Pelagibacter sp.]|nr:ABC transporter substrate-binding protein [Candidatus Pelagibacter sp.]
MRKLYIIVLKVFLIIVFSHLKAISDEKIKIGLIVPLSGEYSYIGNSILKSTRMALNKINDKRITIIPKDTKANPIDTLKVSKELYNNGIKTIIGPVFNESNKYLDELNEVTFLSFTNKIRSNPNNVISAGVNAISQINTIKKYLSENNLKNTVFLIPETEYKKEIEEAIEKSNLILKEKFIYNKDPTLLTKQIEDLTRYQQRKQNLENEIKRIENSNTLNKKKKIDELKKKDTLGFINFDSVIIADFSESLKSVATSLLYTDVSSERIKYIALNQWFDESLLKETSLHPIYFPSINKDNFEIFQKEYIQNFKTIPNQISFLSYDLIGLVYYLLINNDFETNENLFIKKNKFKGKIGIFEINRKTITHQLNFYSIEDKRFKEIF